ncbi:hypothetical protein ACHAQD_009893 [Fusarium lateritium]
MRRLIYISNPDAACITALKRTAPPSQVSGFQELFYNYITESSMPSISLKETTSNVQTCVDTATLPTIRRWKRRFADVLRHVISLNFEIIKKVNEFLDQDLMCSPKGIPLSPLWIEIRADSDALKSVRKIRNSRQGLTQLNVKLDQLFATLVKFTQELS